MVKKYKPKLGLIFLDIGIIILNIIVVLGLFPLTSHDPFKKYEIPAVVFTILWVVTSYMQRRYVSFKNQYFAPMVFRLLYTSLINFSLFAGFILIQSASPFSQYVLFSIMGGIFVTEYFFLFFFFAYKYALQYDAPFSTEEERRGATLLPTTPLTDEENAIREEKITKFYGAKALLLLKEKFSIATSAVEVMEGFNLTELQESTNFVHDTFIQLKKLNNIRGINKMLYLMNEKLPDDGRVVVFYKSSSALKREIYLRYPRVIKQLVYFSYFIYHRVVPNFFLTQRIYFDLTRGEKRMLTKTEILGRVIFCGFTIESQKKIDGVNMVIIRRIKQSEPIKPRRNYGPLIKLKRYGKNGELFYVYKVRTMHPYAEFLQGFIYDTNSLQEGGKIHKDTRISSFGRFARKYWLDELPMVFNLIKGDMKLVGVRPLSAHYFSLYSSRLQKMRIKFRPGLLPPFYADMPKTLEEIEESEMRYLKQCEENGVLKTDVRYFFLILKSIFFTRARSA